jgi:hypothetical protein
MVPRGSHTSGLDRQPQPAMGNSKRTSRAVNRAVRRRDAPQPGLPTLLSQVEDLDV